MSCCGENIPVNQEPYIRRDGKVAFTGNQSMGGNRLSNLSDAIENGDAINLGQLNNLIDSISGIGKKYITGIPINIHTIVYINSDGLLYPANSSDTNIINKVIGITLESKVENSELKVSTFGNVIGFNNLSIDSTYFFDSNGQLTLSPPSTGFSQSIGVASSNTELLLNLQTPVGL